MKKVSIVTTIVVILGLFVNCVGAGLAQDASWVLIEENVYRTADGQLDMGGLQTRGFNGRERKVHAQTFTAVANADVFEIRVAIQPNDTMTYPETLNAYVFKVNPLTRLPGTEPIAKATTKLPVWEKIEWKCISFVFDSPASIDEGALYAIALEYPEDIGGLATALTGNVGGYDANIHGGTFMENAKGIGDPTGYAEVYWKTDLAFQLYGIVK